MFKEIRRLIVRNKVDELKKLIEDGKVGRVDGTTLLIKAVGFRRTQIIELLIETGVNLNERDRNGYTALGKTAEYDDTEAMKLLIEAGADIEQGGGYGRTPLMIACQQGYDEPIKLLLEAGANVAAEDEYGDTALKLLPREGYDDIKLLLFESIVGGPIANSDKRISLDALRKMVKLFSKTEEEMLNLINLAIKEQNNE
jgi:ankyrin repeat protein